MRYKNFILSEEMQDKIKSEHDLKINRNRIIVRCIFSRGYLGSIWRLYPGSIKRITKRDIQKVYYWSKLPWIIKI